MTNIGSGQLPEMVMRSFDESMIFQRKKLQRVILWSIMGVNSGGQ
jgi:hypothetical protein